MAIRALRGATQLSADDFDEMREAVEELLGEMFGRNQISHADLISVIFTATPDLHCGFPATAARGLGLGDVPLLCAVEIEVASALPRVVRVLMHVETAKERAELVHVYRRGAEVLRIDLAQ